MSLLVFKSLINLFGSKFSLSSSSSSFSSGSLSLVGKSSEGISAYWLITMLPLSSSKDVLCLWDAAWELEVIICKSSRLQTVLYLSYVDVIIHMDPFQLTTLGVPKRFNNVCEVLELISMSEVPVGLSGIPRSFILAQVSSSFRERAKNIF